MKKDLLFDAIDFLLLVGALEGHGSMVSGLVVRATFSTVYSGHAPSSTEEALGQASETFLLGVLEVNFEGLFCLQFLQECITDLRNALAGLGVDLILVKLDQLDKVEHSADFRGKER